MNSNEIDKYLYESNSENLLDNEYMRVDIKKTSSNFHLFHKILDSINISAIFLIFIFSVFALNSQRKWTILYSGLNELRNLNNNLTDYISTTEEFYIKEIDLSDDIKKTTSKDLIYLDKINTKKTDNILFTNMKEMIKGIKDNTFQRGY